MKDKRTLDDKTMEMLIIKGMVTDKQYTATVINPFIEKYFDDETISGCFGFIKEHYKKYNKLPPEAIIKKAVKNSQWVFDEIETIDYEVSENYDHLLEETNLYLKEKAFKTALMDGVDLIESGKNPIEYKSIMENALAKDIKIDLGVDYWYTLGDRLKRVLNETENRVSSSYAILDEFIGGGFPPYTLSTFASKIHGFKSNFLINTASRQAINGLNPLIISLEMSEDAICQRLDSIHSKQEINSIYVKEKEKNAMIKELTRMKKENNNLGNLIMKELPPGKTSVSDIDGIVREYHYRSIYPSVIYVDYLQLLGASTGEKRYEELKHISEELRSLSLTHSIPIISVLQLNKDGIFSDFDSVDYTYVAGSLDIAATCDFMAIFGQSENDLMYESELHYKIVKNRLGGRVGEHGKLYIDKHNLKMYDESEMDMWIEDAKVSGDDRKRKKRG